MIRVHAGWRPIYLRATSAPVPQRRKAPASRREPSFAIVAIAVLGGIAALAGYLAAFG